MKKLLSVILLIAAHFSYGQKLQLPVDSVTHKVTYSQDIQVPGASGEQLYQKARSFVLNGLEKTKLENFWGDPNTMSMHVKGVLRYYSTLGAGNTQNMLVGYQLTIVCHESSYQYTFTDFFMGDYPDVWRGDVQGGDFDQDNKGKVPRRQWEKIKSWVDKDIKKNIEKLKQTIQ